MRAGRLDHRVELFCKEVIAADEGFGDTYDWVSQGTVWAVVHRPSFNHGNMNGSADAVLLTQGITIRPRFIEKGWRVKLNGQFYEVLHIDTSRRKELTLTMQAVEVQT